MARPRLRRLRALRRTLGSMLGFVWRAGPGYCAGLYALEIMQGLLPLATAWVMKLLFDMLVQQLGGSAPAGLWQLFLALVLLQAVIGVLGQVCQPLSGYLSAELGRRLTLDVQLTIYRKITGLQGLAALENPGIHDQILLAQQGAQQGPGQLLSISTHLIRNAIMLAAFLGTLLALSPLLALVMAGAVIPQVLIDFKLRRFELNLAVENSPKGRRAAYYSSLFSRVEYAKELRLFNLMGYFCDAFERMMREIYLGQRRQQRREIRGQIVLALIASTVSAAAFILVIARAFAGTLGLGDVSLYVSAVLAVQAALSGIVVSLSSLGEHVLFFRYFTNLLALRDPLTLADDPAPIAPLGGSIELRDVSFRYSPDHPWVLRHINLVIPKDACLALVGLNGAGKTTLVKLLTRCYDPTEGAILWDGVDIRAFDPQCFRARISAIFQDFLRYDLTARENIGLGDLPQLEDEQAIRRAARASGVDRLIEELPQGYATVLSRWLTEDGPSIDLSGGEWQKLGLARMFLREADLLILDEPTAALDVYAEHELYRHFLSVLGRRTSLLITHRFSTVAMANLIAVLEDGRITEYGTHAELLKLDGAYAELYHLQAEHYQALGTPALV